MTRGRCPPATAGSNITGKWHSLAEPMHKAVGECGLSGALWLNVIFTFERLGFLATKNQTLQ